jgi:transposase-like protein
MEGNMAARKSYTAEQKVRIIKKHLVDGLPLSDVCDQHGIHPSVFYRWQKAFFEKGHLAFENSEGKISKADKEVARLQRKIAHKNEVLAELMEEHVALKKSLGEA